jgi:DNA invertase Pin-like site-specific DNA recombinase
VVTEPAKPLRLVMYLRVSTAGQLDGYGLDTQENDCRRWAKKHGHRIVKVCTDGGISGTKTDEDRPGLTEALSTLDAGEADGLLAPNLDRLARELTVQEAALSVVWAYGRRVFTVDHGEHLADDEDDPMRKFVRQVMGAAAELERGLIAKRLRNGRKAKAEQGGYAYGAPAYGQRAEDRSLTVDSSEAEVLDRMRHWHASGLGVRGIADRLNELGVPTKRGARWHPTTVARLVNPDARAAARQQSARTRAFHKDRAHRIKAERILTRLS